MARRVAVRWRVAIVVLVSLALASCKRSNPATPCHKPRPKTQAQLPTTHGGLFLNNLRAQISSFEKNIAGAKDAQPCLRLSRAMFVMAQYRGEVKDMAAATKVLDTCPESQEAELAGTPVAIGSPLRPSSTRAQECESLQNTAGRGSSCRGRA